MVRYVLALAILLISASIGVEAPCPPWAWCGKVVGGGGGGGGGTGGTVALSPVNGSTLAGQSVTFTATTTSNVASVEFRMGGYWLGTVTTPPFTINWNSGWAFDGNSHVQAIARDGFGNILATADNAYQISNYGNTFALTTPNLANPLSGTVTLTASATDTVNNVLDTWIVQIDGVSYHSKVISPAPSPFTFNLDTTTLFNGQHELYLTTISQNVGGANTLAGTVQHHQMFTTANAHALLGVAPNVQNAYIGLTGTVNVGCQEIFTDNTKGACSSPQYTSSDTTIATVNGAGLVTGSVSKEGYVTITVTDSSGKSGNAYVWVRTAGAIPHFAGNGTGILTTFSAANSLYVTSPFYTQPSIIANEPGNGFGGTGVSELHRAGVNTEQDQSYDGGPTYGGAPCDSMNYTTWQTNFDNTYPAKWALAANNNFHIMGLGDTIARNVGQEGWCTINWPSANLALAHTIQVLYNSGVAVSQEMIDEGSNGWGSMTNPGTGLVGQTGPYVDGSADFFTQIVCSGSTCTVTWPNHVFVNNETNPGTNFALAGSINSNLNTVFTFGQPANYFVVTNSTLNTFDFTPLGSVTGTFNSTTDPGLTFLQWGRYPCLLPSGNYSTACAPPVPNNTLSQFSTWMHQATNPLPVSWPGLGISPVQVHGNWIGSTSLSDYASHYWDSFRIRQAYAWGRGVAENNFEMRTQFLRRQQYMRMDAPQILITTVSGGPLYTKQSTTGGYYIPLTDTWSAGGVPLSAPFSQIMTIAALGGAGSRNYLFENSTTVANKYTAPNGSGMQTGGSPYTADPQSTYAWHQVGYASNLLFHALQPYIINTPLPSPYFGPILLDGPTNSPPLNDVGNSWSTVAARQGFDADLLLIVNGTDAPQTYTANLASYLVGGTPQTARYLATADYIRTDLLISGTTSDIVTVPEGGALAYLVPRNAAWTNTPTQAVSLLPPNVGQSQTSVVYSYTYSGDLTKQTQATNCTAGCTLHLDRRLGDVFYQYIYMGATGIVSGRSAVTTLPQLTSN